MKPFPIILLFLLVISPFTPASALSNPDICVPVSNEARTVLEFRFAEPPLVQERGYDRLVMPLEGTTRTVGKPELPIITRLVAIPSNTSCKARIVSIQYRSLHNLDIIPYISGTDYEPKEWVIDREFYQQDRWYPEKTIELGSPGIMRDIRILPLTIYPFSYNPLKREVRMIERITIELEHLPGTDCNEKTFRHEGISPVFEKFYEKNILNFDFVRGQRGTQRGSYLIIVPDALYNNVLPLSNWKHKRGDKTIVKKLSEVGYVNTQIRNYISTAYYTWDPPPDQVLIIGDVDNFPTFYDYDPRHGQFASDIQYSLLEGSDLFPEVLLGRISVDNSLELDVVVAKTLSYEKSPYSPTTWLGKFLCVAGEDFDSQVETKIWVQEFAEGFGYTVDTLFSRSGANATMISNAINNGRAYVNYRGGGWGYGWREPYYTTTDILVYLNNGWKLPVMTSVNCGSGKFNWSSGECFGELWIRSGTPTNPKGGVAFVGASHWTYASRNNALDVGMYRAIFNDSLTVLGTAMNAGKLFMYQCYPEMDTTRVTYGVYHILGDPSLHLWTAIPTTLTVSHPALIPLGNTGVDIEVRDHLNAPLPGALCCLSKGTDVYVYGYTNSEGICSFQIHPTSTGTMDITVTGLNRIPYEGTATVVSSTLYVGYRSHSIDDDNAGGSSGNGDGLVNPGETIEMPVMVGNFGNQTVYNLTGTLRTNTSSATVTDSLEDFGTIAPGDSIDSAEDFDFAVSDLLRFGDSLEFSLYLSDNDSTWYSHIAVPVFACQISYVNFSFIDGGNGKPEPGDTGDLTVTVKNTGDATAQGLTAILSTTDPMISIHDSTGSFGDILPDANASNSSDRFNISISPQAFSGQKIKFHLHLSASGYYEDTVSFIMQIEPTSNVNPTGPDEYGYYAYDSYDMGYTEVPVYNWVELDPGYGGIGTLLPLGEDGTATIPLPFSFPFYGIADDSLSICSNGWLAMGTTSLSTYANWPIPDTYGPRAMIAPFWDDLSDSLPAPHHIYYTYDNTNHRFIVEWSRIYHTYADSIPHPADPETFEAILYDPVYNPTVTGDGEIIYQYMSILNPLSSTIGIENHEETIGLQYVYNGYYADGASAIDNDLAIKLTTDPPVAGIEEYEPVSPWEEFSLSAFPNPFFEQLEIRLHGVSGYRSTGEPVIQIYDVSGRKVREISLLPFSFLLGAKATWDGRDNAGMPLPNGIYLVRARYGSHIITKKITKLSLY